jgi:hypothetical protein
MTGEGGWGMFLHVLIGRHILISVKSAFITTSYSKVLNILTSQLVVRVRTGKTEVPSNYVRLTCYRCQHVDACFEVSEKHFI